MYLVNKVKYIKMREVEVVFMTKNSIRVKPFDKFNRKEWKVFKTVEKALRHQKALATEKKIKASKDMYFYKGEIEKINKELEQRK